MLILAKSILSITLGLVIGIVVGLIVLPFLRKLNARQTVSNTINKRHQLKNGTPTIGGIIFIIPPILISLILWMRASITWNHNLTIVIMVFLAYGLLGFIDDFLKIRYHNNKGLPTLGKLLFQVILAIVFTLIYTKNGGTSSLDVSLLGIHIEMGWFYAVFVLFILVGTTNAVNISDGLDGLCGGLSVMAFLAYGVIAYGSSWIVGYDTMAIFAFSLVGSILAFLLFNSHPAKVFMGDTGSLALGGALASIAILTHHEISLALIGGVFVISAWAINYFSKR